MSEARAGLDGGGGGPAPAATLAAVAAASACLLPPGWLAAAVAALGLAAWWRLAGAGRRALTAALLAAMVVALALGEAQRRRWASPERIGAEVGRQVDAVWTELEEALAVATEAFDGVSPAAETSAALFRRLDEIAGRDSEEIGLLLFDPNGMAAAWAGEGLVHEPAAEDLPAAGRLHRAGFERVTLLTVGPAGGEAAGDTGDGPAGGWRLAAGRSLDSGELPRPLAGVRVRWAPLEPGERPVGAARQVEASSPPIVWRAEPAGGEGAGALRRATAALGAAALLVVVMAGALRQRRRRRRALAAGARVAAAVLVAALVGRALDAEPRVIGLAAALVAAAGAVAVARAAGRGGPPPLVTGPLAALAALGTPLLAGAVAGRLDLGAAFAAPGEAWLLRGAALLPVLALLAWTGRRPAAGARPRRSAAGGRAWWAVLALGAGAALLDWSALAAIGLTLGTLAAAGWAAGNAPLGRRRGVVGAGVLVLLAAMVAALGWEIVDRERLERRLAGPTLDALAPPAELERVRLRRRIATHLEEGDLAALTLRDPARLDPRDLAFALWRRSPLSAHGALSALAVTTPEGIDSSFGFGLPLTEEGEIDRSPLRGMAVELDAAAGALVEGAAELALEGRPWGVVRFWMQLRPGYALSDHPVENLAENLLRNRLEALQPIEELLGPARYAFYAPGGELLSASLAEVPPAADLVPGRRVVVATPLGPAAAYAADGANGRRAILLPVLGPAAALARVGTHAFGALLAAVLGLAVGRLPRLPALLPALREAMASYSLRLPILYALLIMLPLLVLNVVLVRIAGQRLEAEQQRAARQALDSAQRVLGEYVLTLDPGFGIDTTLDDELLAWLSRVVHNDLNLYWGSDVYASSKRELFTAGLLPKRIPGEIFARLALGRAHVASRTSQAGGARYLELYTPIRVPGVPLEGLRLYASLPRLAQQEEAAEALALLRRKVILVTVALALLLAAVGSRLARSFTQPVMEIVRGTQRIAAGARSLELQPAERELATLVDAIDQMAGKIAEGRQRLLREKEVVDRMIDNVTSAVVSLDRQRRVLMSNRTAHRMLEVRIGESLDEALARDASLAPLAAALARSRRLARAVTARMASAGDGEREWTVVWVPLPGEGEPSDLVVIEDVTEVLRVERLEAWAEMARMIAHEIKNPLTPIRLSTEHLREVKAGGRGNFDEVFERCTENILEQVAELQQISSEFSSYSRIPRIEPRAGDLADAVARVVDGYRAAPPAGVRIELARPAGALRASFDEKLLGRALRNLIENAMRAVAGGGAIEVSVEAVDGAGLVRVADDGPGIDPAKIGRIFEPYFSTHDTGTGLGLPIARRIVEEHGGEIRARNRDGGGLEVALTVPLA